MSSPKLQGVRIAILVTGGFREFELLDTRRLLGQAGASTFVVAPMHDKVKGLNPSGGEAEVPVDILLKSATPQDFHALLLPGGGTNASRLSLNDEAIEFAKSFMMVSKPVAAIGEAVAVLIQTGTVRSRTLTSNPTLEQSLRKAGANYINQSIVHDGNLITAQGPEDIPAFVAQLIRLLAELRVHSSEMRKTA